MPQCGPPVAFTTTPRDSLLYIIHARARPQASTIIFRGPINKTSSSLRCRSPIFRRISRNKRTKKSRHPRAAVTRFEDPRLKKKLKDVRAHARAPLTYGGHRSSTSPSFTIGHDDKRGPSFNGRLPPISVHIFIVLTRLSFENAARPVAIFLRDAACENIIRDPMDIALKS